MKCNVKILFFDRNWNSTEKESWGLLSRVTILSRKYKWFLIAWRNLVRKVFLIKVLGLTPAKILQKPNPNSKGEAKVGPKTQFLPRMPHLLTVGIRRNQ